MIHPFSFQLESWIRQFGGTKTTNQQTKPQEKFLVKVDNSPAVWKPKILTLKNGLDSNQRNTEGAARDKPNAKVPLDVTIGDNGQSQFGRLFKSPNFAV